MGTSAEHWSSTPAAGALRIVIASGKGGTGKTTVATGLASVLASRGDRVTYVDCDVEEPNGHLFLKPDLHQHLTVPSSVAEVDPERCAHCGRCAEACREGALLALPNSVVTFPNLCNGCGACVLACPERAIHESPRPIGTVSVGESQLTSSAGRLSFVQGETMIGETKTPEVIRAALEAAPAGDVLVLDAPPGTTCPAVEAMRTADVALLVTEPTPFGLNDLRLAVEVAQELNLPFAVAVNRAGSGDDSVADHCRAEGIPVLMCLPDDRGIARAYSQGDLITDARPGLRPAFASLATGLRQLAPVPGGSRRRRLWTLETPRPAQPELGGDRPSAIAPPADAGGPPELVIISGKGGSGKTSVAASLLALASESAAGVDADADAANLHLVTDAVPQRSWPFSGGGTAVIDPAVCMECGLCGEYCSFDAICQDIPDGAHGFAVDPLACEGCGVCVDVCPVHAPALVATVQGEWFVSDSRHGPLAHARLTPGQGNSGKLVSLLREEGRALARSSGRQLVICDGSPGIGCAVIASITAAAAVLIVAEPTLSGLHDFRRVADLVGQLGVTAGVCVNKADLNPSLTTRLEIEAASRGLPVLGRIRYDEVFTLAQIRGVSVVELDQTPAASDIRRLWHRVRAMVHPGSPMTSHARQSSSSSSGGDMTTRIAVPVAGGTLCAHFGHCEAFAIFDVDPESSAVSGRRDLTPPEHQPGVYPRWLAEQGATVILAGGMGGRAQDLFSENGIQVVVGIEAGEPESVVRSYLAGQLVSGANPCDH